MTAQSIAGVAPAAPWQITVLGQDRGVIFLTFANDFTSTGYGISLDALGPFTIAGTWDNDANGDIVGGFTEFVEGGSQAGIIEGRVRGNGGFVGHVKTTHGPQKFKAPAPGPIPDLSGSWTASVESDGKKTLETFTLTPSTNNVPGWFDLNGNGIDNNGSFALSGAVLVTTDRNAAGYTISNFGTSTLQAAFIGKVSKKANRLVLRGKDENDKGTTLQAEKPKTK
ncbi:MAG: hypothetical protein WCS70_00530 [Verrucomicrobiota bacterium]